MKNDELTVRTPLGELVVKIKADPDYPGISVAFCGNGIFLVLKEKQINEIVFIYFYKFNTKQRKWSTWGAPLLLLFRRSLVRIIGQGSCYDAYCNKGTYLIGGETYGSIRF